LGIEPKQGQVLGVWKLQEKQQKNSKNITRGKLLVWSQKGPLLLFFGLLSYLSPPWVWMWCTIQGIFMLCVMSVVTTMVKNANIGMHDN
jgi:hypothetical protein